MDLDLLTKKEAAGILKITVRTLERYIECGQLRKFKKGGSVRILRSDLNTFFKKYFMPSQKSA